MHRPPLPPGIFLVLISTRGWVDPRAMVWSEGNVSLKNPVIPPGIDPGTVRLVAQRLNHYATQGPLYTKLLTINMEKNIQSTKCCPFVMHAFLNWTYSASHYSSFWLVNVTNEISPHQGTFLIVFFLCHTRCFHRNMLIRWQHYARSCGIWSRRFRCKTHQR